MDSNAMVNAVQVYTKIFGAALVKSWCSPSEIMVQPSEIKVQPMKSWFGHCRSYSTITYIELFCAHIIIYFVLATIMLHFSLIVHNDKFHSKHIQQLEAIHNGEGAGEGEESSPKVILPVQYCLPF